MDEMFEIIKAGAPNGPPEQALYRIQQTYYLRELGANSYVMQYRRGRQGDPELRKLAKWANRRWAYWSGPYITA
jgi:hypothetical protein